MTNVKAFKTKPRLPFRINKLESFKVWISKVLIYNDFDFFKEIGISTKFIIKKDVTVDLRRNRNESIGLVSRLESTVSKKFEGLLVVLFNFVKFNFVKSLYKYWENKFNSVRLLNRWFFWIRELGIKWRFLSCIGKLVFKIGSDLSWFNLKNL